MSEIELEYEHNNKSTLEKCCKIMSASTVAKKIKLNKTNARRDIESILEQKELRKLVELSL